MKRPLLHTALGLITLFILTSTVHPVKAENQDRFTALSQKETAVSLYPMPVTSTLHIDIGKLQSSDPDILIFDLLGNQVETGTVVRETGSVFSIDLSGKKAGYYFIRIRTTDETISRRITVAP